MVPEGETSSYSREGASEGTARALPEGSKEGLQRGFPEVYPVAGTIDYQSKRRAREMQCNPYTIALHVPVYREVNAPF
jgi:hypothetical protein